MKKLQSLMIPLLLTASFSTVAFAQAPGDDESHGGRATNSGSTTPMTANLGSAKYGSETQGGLLLTIETVLTVLRASGVFVASL